jgi:hypothetical protein
MNHGLTLKNMVMKVNEDLSILFWLWRQKASKDCMMPIYVRITVKGDRDGFSSGKKIHPDFWDEETATASRICPTASLLTVTLPKQKQNWNGTIINWLLSMTKSRRP